MLRFPNRTELRDMVSIKGDIRMKQKYKLETITPVHIGSGETLNHIDGFYANGRWYHIDLDKVLAHPNTDINTLTSEMSQRDFRWTDYFAHNNMNGTEFSTYSLLCSQNPETTEIREAIKSVDNRPYIPGSSIKGAIRTALLGEVLIQNEEIYDKSSQWLQDKIDQQPRGNPKNERPAQKIEAFAFGPDPNHNLLRALHVSDTTPIESDSLEIGTAWTVTLNSQDKLVKKIQRGRQYKNFVQHFQTGQNLTFTLKIDELLFREREKNILHFNKIQEKILKTIPKVHRSLANAIMETELEFFDIYDLDPIANFYDQTIDLHADLTEGEFFMQIGWGSGYHANTITGILANTHDPPRKRWLEIQKRFKLGESRSRRGHYNEQEFPKTRRIIYHGQNPIAPLGWVKISPI